jgi:hypothetical protein
MKDCSNADRRHGKGPFCMACHDLTKPAQRISQIEYLSTARRLKYRTRRMEINSNLIPKFVRSEAKSSS